MHFSIVARGTTNASGGPLHAGPLHAQRDADVNACSRYDIYFIGVSLPSSMMIYNCCSLGCNYYNYRFFVWPLGTGPRLGPGPDALFAPSPSMRLHPFGPPSLGPLVPVPVCAFLPLSLSLYRSRFFPLYPTRSLFFLSREQRPDLRRLRRRNGFWKLDSRDVESSRTAPEKPLSLPSPSFNAKLGHSIPITID